MTSTTTIRFFCVAYVDDTEDHIDTVEITESCFVALTRKSSGTAPIQYDRHTVSENGVSQVCLTLDLDDWPYIEDLQTV